MKKSKQVLVLLILFILFIPTQKAYSSTLIKIGKACKTYKETVIYKNKNFICIKSNNKYIWAKNNFILKSFQKPESYDTFNSWAVEFNGENMIKTALYNTDLYFGKVVPDNSYELIIDEAVSKKDRKWNIQMLDYSYGSFSNIPKDKMKVFLGKSNEWYTDALKYHNVWIGDPNSICRCTDKNLIGLITLNTPIIWDTISLSNPAHDLFHTIQYALLGFDHARTPTDSPKSVPVWLMEGSASLYGFYILEKINFGYYMSGRNIQIRHLTYKNVKSLSEYKTRVFDPYGIGTAATEYLVASIGFEKMLDIFRFTGSEGSFEIGFKKATGIEIIDFYKKFDEAIILKSIKINI